MKHGNRIVETTTTTGTGTYTRAGAKTGFQSFMTLGVGETCHYLARMGDVWEIGLGTITSDGLERTQFVESSTGSEIDWDAGEKDLVQTLLGETVDELEIPYQTEAPSSPPVGKIWVDSDEEPLEVGHSHDNKSTLDGITGPVPLILGADIQVTVGSGGDYSNINEALAYLSKYYPLYKSNGITAEIVLLAGFVMEEQVLVQGVDLGWVTISGQDAETVIDRASLTVISVGLYPAFSGVNNATIPIIGQLFSMNAEGTETGRDGISLYRNSKAMVLSGCGIKTAGRRGINLDLNCFGAIGGGVFTNAIQRGISATANSFVEASSVVVSQAGEDGVFAALNSFINFDTGVATACGSRGLYVIRGSSVSADTANISEAVSIGAQAVAGSNINLRNANTRKGVGDSTSDISVNSGSLICAFGATGGVSQTVNTITANGIIFK